MPADLRHMSMWPRSSASLTSLQSSAGTASVGGSVPPQSKTAVIAFDWRWTSGTLPCLVSYPPPTPSGLASLTAAPEWLPSACTSDSAGAHHLQAACSLLSSLLSQLEGSFIPCGLPVCCPGTPPSSLGLFRPLVGSVFHGSTLMKTANLKTAITALPDPVSRQPPIPQRPQACSHVWGLQLSWTPDPNRSVLGLLIPNHSCLCSKG